jgi:hypothetical protein
MKEARSNQGKMAHPHPRRSEATCGRHEEELHEDGLHRGGQLQEQGATTIETVSTTSPIRGGTVVLTGSKATATGEHRQRGPTTSNYGSDSTDRLQLEPRPPSTEVTVVAQTEPSEETIMDVQEMREDGEQQHEPPQEQQQQQQGPPRKTQRNKKGGIARRAAKAKKAEGE